MINRHNKLVKKHSELLIKCWKQRVLIDKGMNGFGSMKKVKEFMKKE